MKKSTKRMIALLMAVVLMLGLLAACTSAPAPAAPEAPAAPGAPEAPAAPDPAPAGQPVTLRFANIFPDGAYQSRAMAHFAELVNERSENITVDTFFNGILGTETEISESVSAGVVEMAAVGAAMQIFLPNLMAAEMPFVFEGWDHAYAVLADPRFYDVLTVGAEEANIIPLGFCPNGFRMFSANRAIESMEDFAGFRLRLPNIPHYLAMGEALGASFVALPLPEVFTALEQGVIDGQDNPLMNTITARFYELQTHIIASNHMLTTHMWYVNADFYNSLTPEDRQIIRDAYQEAITASWAAIRVGEAEEIAYIEEQGLVFHRPSDEFREDMRNAMADVWAWFAEVAPNGQEALDLIAEIRESM